MYTEFLFKSSQRRTRRVWQAERGDSTNLHFIITHIFLLKLNIEVWQFIVQIVMIIHLLL